MLSHPLPLHPGWPPTSEETTSPGWLQRLRYRVSGTPGSLIKEIVLLRDVSGVLHPRRLMLLLGPPGSGKTTLMRALAGQLKGRRAPRVGTKQVLGDAHITVVVASPFT